MSNESTEKVFFEIGVGEDPRAVSALESLAKRIEQMQAQMLAGVKDVEQAAKAAEVAVGRAGAAATSARAGAVGATSGRPSMSFPASYTATAPAGLAPPGLAPPSSVPQSSRMPAPFATVPASGRASGRGTTSMPAPFATVPAGAFTGNVPPSSAPQGSMPPVSAPPSASSGAPKDVGIGPDAIERMDLFAKGADKAFKGVLDLGRGMALLGLMSEENSEKFLKSLVAIEGVVSTIKGGADLAEGLTKMARGSAGRAAAGAASAAAGAASTGGGFMSMTVGGVGVGVAGTAAAAAAALASVSLVAVELKEIFSGTANEVGSVTDTIATWEVSMVSWMGEMTGWFDLVGNAATKEAESKLALVKLESERKDAIDTIKGDAARAVEFGLLDSANKLSRFTAGAGMGVDSSAEAEAQIKLDLQMKYEESMKRVTALQEAGAEGTVDFANAMKTASMYGDRLAESSQNMVNFEKQAAKEKIDGAQKAIQLANQELDSRIKMLDALNEQRMTAAERFAAMDDLQKSEAVQALRQAQTQGATSLSDQQRSLLRSVGGSEATKFAREADLAEARAAGFDASFGAGFDKEQARLEGERAKFTAVIQEQNQIIINIEDRNKQIIEETGRVYAKVIQEGNKDLIRGVQENANKLIQAQNQKYVEDRRAAKSANK